MDSHRTTYSCSIYQNKMGYGLTQNNLQLLNLSKKNGIWTHTEQLTVAQFIKIKWDMDSHRTTYSCSIYQNKMGYGLTQKKLQLLNLSK